MGIDGLINRGNLGRLKQKMRAAVAGEKLTIGFIGGSITQGAAATEDSLCYAARVAAWWVKRYPQAEIVYINAGIGATTSQFGAARVQEDLLVQKPDVVIIEFSVNDNDEAPYTRRELFRETYEGLVRKVYGASCSPAVVLVHNVRYSDGSSEEEMHAALGQYYQLPCVSIKHTLYPLVRDGKIPACEVTPDGLHPNDEGHRLVAESICKFFEWVSAECGENEEACLLPLKTVTENHYENAMRMNNTVCSPVLNGFRADFSKQSGVRDVFKKGWYANEKNSSIVYHVTGSEIAVMYRKSVKQPAPVAVAVIDNDEVNAVVLDANFDEDWGDKAYMQTVAHHISNKPHTLEIRLTDVRDNNQVPFYLINIIVSH